MDENYEKWTQNIWLPDKIVREMRHRVVRHLSLECD